MARKTLKIDLIDRGVSKRFLITEAPASVAEEWAVRAFLAMAAAGVQLPEGVDGLSDLERLGLAGLMEVGLGALGKIPYTAAKPLLDMLMDCVQLIPDPNDDRIARPLIEDDIEDVKVRFILRKEVFKLHLGF